MAVRQGAEALAAGYAADPTRAPASPFADFAERYRLAGIPVLPFDGKERALIQGFNYWTPQRPPGRRTVSEWRDLFPQANVAIVTRLLGAIVADLDDPAIEPEVLHLAGDTPLRVLTPGGGLHLWYGNPGGLEGAQRAGGRLLDFKGGGRGDLVLAPGSVSPTTGTVYAMDCAAPPEDVAFEFAARLSSSPPLARAAYDELMRRPTGRTTVAVGAVHALPAGRVERGARNDALTKFVYGRALVLNVEPIPEAAAAKQLAAEAMAYSEQLFDPPLPARQVVGTARSAWRATQRGSNNPLRRGARVRPARDAMGHLAGDAAAFALLAVLTEEHPHELQGFIFSPAAAARAGLIPGWGRKAYDRALSVLLAAERAVMVEAPRRGRGGAPTVAIAYPLRLRPTMQSLLSTCRDADSAALAALLVEEHWGRRDEFQISVAAIAMSSGPLGTWTRERIRAARSRLVGPLLEPVRRPRPRRNQAPPATFRFRAGAIANAPNPARIDKPLSSIGPG